MSFITVSAEKVFIAAQALIDRIMAERTKRDEQRIAFAMQKRYRFWRKEKMTREQAIEYLEACEAPFGWRSIYAWGDLEQAKKLLTLAKNGDPVNINTSDADLLWGG